MIWFLPVRRLSAFGAMAVLIALALAAGDAQAQSAKARELLLKAAFLYNFAKFVEWPPAAFAAPDAPLTICVHGGDAFDVIAQAMNGKSVGNRPLSVVNPHRSAVPVICHVTFIGAEEPESSYGAHLKSPHALTVGDRDRFARTGGIVGLVTVDNKIRFEVNLRMARAAGLRINAALLRLAAEVIE
jgi:YfiR/HmsC-like